MEFISPHRYIKNTSKMEKFSQSTCWILAEDFKHIKGNEWVPYNQAGWKAEGKRKRRGGGMRSLLLEGSWKWERIFTSGEVPSPVRGSAETEGVFRGLEKSRAPGLGLTEWGLHRWFVLPPSTPQPEMGVCGCTQGLGAGICNLESQPRKQTDSGSEKTAWGDRTEELCSRGCLEGSMDHCRGKAQRPSDMRRAGLPSQPLLVLWRLSPQALRRAPIGARPWALAVASFPSLLGYLVCLSAPWEVPMFQLLLQDPLTWVACLPCSLPCLPPAWWGRVLGNSRADSIGRNTCRGGAQTTAKP